MLEHKRTTVDDSTLQESAAGARSIKAKGIAVAHLCDTVQDSIPQIGTWNITAEDGDARFTRFYILDAAGNALSSSGTPHPLIRFWIATTEYGAPDAAGNTIAMATGAVVQTITPDAHYLVASGNHFGNASVAFWLGVAGAATRYIMAGIGGKIYSSGAITFEA